MFTILMVCLYLCYKKVLVHYEILFFHLIQSHKSFIAYVYTFRCELEIIALKGQTKYVFDFFLFEKEVIRYPF